MANIDGKTPDSPEDQIRQLQKENNRLQRIIKRHETQLQHLDKMASANEKTNIALYKELEVLQQQTEAQAREAQIEAALERVRARTMGMHKSDELRDVVGVFYEQLKPFGVGQWGVEIVTCDEPSGLMGFWFSHKDEVLPECHYLHYLGHPVLERQWKVWKDTIPLLTTALSGEDKLDYERYLFEETTLKSLSEEVKAEIMAENHVVFSHVSMKHGFLGAIDVVPIADDKAAILKRFAKVFEQTYTRFLDLQKAEAQAREAQIEAALERVRARSMAMHKSEELLELVKLLYKVDRMRVR
jgi:multidrug efflux pump subunit AcrA (membrane-fusion protein)